mgnify:CR=1 FL=1
MNESEKAILEFMFVSGATGARISLTETEQPVLLTDTQPYLHVQRIPSKGRWILARAYLSRRFLPTRWIEIIWV